MSLSDFKVLAKLGEGAYSSVYKVIRLQDNLEYALKKVKLMNLSDKEKQNALNEVRILASIRNQAIIGYKESFIDEGSNSLCICMEYSNNGDLFQKITEYQKKGQLFSEQEIWHIFIQIVKGLKALHDLRIYHRDLKSANVFLTKEGMAKLGDMNVSKVAKKGLLYTQTGTPYYASPEVWKDQPYDSKSDIWSLGCVLYEMTTLKPPFRAEDMEGLFKKVIRGYYPRIPPHYSPDLNNVIRALLQVAPHLRPSADKILQLPAVVKRMNEIHLVESDEGIPILLNTIRIPKNLGNLKERMPKPNYTGLKTRKIDRNQFLSTLGTNGSNTVQDKSGKIMSMIDTQSGASSLPKINKQAKNIQQNRANNNHSPASNYQKKQGNQGSNQDIQNVDSSQIYIGSNEDVNATNQQPSQRQIRSKKSHGHSLHSNQAQQQQQANQNGNYQQLQEELQEIQMGRDSSGAAHNSSQQNINGNNYKGHQNENNQQQYYNENISVRPININQQNNNQDRENYDNSVIHRKPKPYKQGAKKQGYEREVLKNRNIGQNEYEKQLIYQQDKKIKQLIDIHSLRQNDYEMSDRSNIHKIYSLKQPRKYDPYVARYNKQKQNQYKNILDIEGESKPIMAKGYGKNRMQYKQGVPQHENGYPMEERQGKLPNIGGSRLPKINGGSPDNSNMLPMIQGQSKVMGLQQQQDREGQKIREISRAYKVNIGHLDELKERYRQIKRLENQKREKYRDYINHNASQPHKKLEKPKYSNKYSNI